MTKTAEELIEEQGFERVGDDRGDAIWKVPVELIDHVRLDTGAVLELLEEARPELFAARLEPGRE